jgi:hypothetical protein
MAQNSISPSSPHLTTPESSLAYSPPIMAVKHLNLPGIPKSTTSVKCKACNRPRKARRVTGMESNAASRMDRLAWAVTTVSAVRMSAQSWLRDIQNNDVLAINV